MSSLFAYIFAPGDMWIILIVALLLFGNRLPGVMRSLGKGVTEFKKGLEGVEDEKDKAVKKDDEPKKVEEEKKVDQQQPQT